MTDIELPGAIRAFIDATNAADSTAFVAAFTPDACLNDWGREFHGPQGVAAWNETDNIGVQAHFDLLSARRGPVADSYVVKMAVSGNGFNGTGPFDFRLRDGLIASLKIS
ncbi:nuclear transport factor 2 family protein [Streptomyces sp. NPDC005498]|uniref:nuclear transport factor 2 family protein n=1 Tax=Streptomyces sp. NPDC005498 TaxID=3364717 RepID=UPI003684397D